LSPAAATSLGYCRHSGNFGSGSGKNGWLGPELVCMAMWCVRFAFQHEIIIMFFITTTTTTTTHV
jgi:hypothetical protein